MMDAEKENVFRTLREEPLLATSFWCRFNWHRWTKYREPEVTLIKYDKYITQERRCACCNVAERKILHRHG
jgi:hypothetical protein